MYPDPSVISRKHIDEILNKDTAEALLEKKDLIMPELISL